MSDFGFHLPVGIRSAQSLIYLFQGFLDFFRCYILVCYEGVVTIGSFSMQVYCIFILRPLFIYIVFYFLVIFKSCFHFVW